MKHSEAVKALGVPERTEQDDVNPLRVAINYEFARNAHGDKRDYRERAIDRCVEHKVDFHSEQNTVYESATRFVAVKCPACGSMLNGTGGVGNFSFHSIDYRCDCGVTVTLSVPSDGFFGVRFPEKKSPATAV